MIRQHHQLNGHDFEQTLGDCESQGSLARCSPWGHKESDVTALEEQAMYGYICYICYVWLSVHAIMLYTGQGKMCSVTLCCDTKAEKA